MGQAQEAVAGSAGLPLTLVDGITVATGAYPTRDRLLSLAHRTDAVAEDAAVAPQVLPTPVTQRVDLGLTAVTSSTATSSTATPSTATASGGCCGGGASGGSGCC